MTFALVNYPAIGLLRAQGRFNTERKISGICAGLFLILAFLGAWCGGALSMAIAVAIYNVLSGILFLRCTLGPDWRQIGSIFIPPLVLSTLAIGSSYLVGLHIAINNRMGCLERISVILVITAPLYAVLVRLLMPDLWKEMLTHLRPLWRRAMLILRLGKS
jgi:hypothetical protein